MNNTRRDNLARIQFHFTVVAEHLEAMKAILEDEKAEEETTFDEASEGKQNGDWGQESQACTEAMQTLIDAIDSIDLSEPMDELGRAIDRYLEAPVGKLTKAEAEARRFERLPQWAKDAEKRATERMNAAIEKSKAKFQPWKEGSERPAFKSYDGPLDGMEVPCDTIVFPQVGVRVSYNKHWDCIELHAEGFGTLVFSPSSANVGYVKKVNDIAKIGATSCSS